ncbi:MAG: hypothetical protein GXO36_05975, partial [Chloroflexi bacterium]|nr:hypothetical protein [Chloroflexota bacterium]
MSTKAKWALGCVLFFLLIVSLLLIGATLFLLTYAGPVYRIEFSPTASISLSPSPEGDGRTLLPTAVPTTTLAPNLTPTEDDTTTTPISPQLRALLQRLEQETQELRGLVAKHPVEHEFVSREEMKRRMREQFEEEITPEDVRETR